MGNYLKINIEKPIKLVGAGHFISTGDWIHPCRKMDNIEFIMSCQGVAHLQHGDNQYDLKPGGIATFLPNVQHKGYKKSTDQVAFYWFHIVGNHDIIADKEAYDAFYKMRSGIDNGLSHVYIPLNEQYTSTHRFGILFFNQLLHIYKEKKQYYSKTTRDYWATMLLLELHQLSYHHWLIENDQHKERKLTQITEWIKANSHHPITYDTVATQFNYNKKNYLNRYFKSKKIGVTINHYIHIERIEKKAKELLYRTDKTIKEIAYTVGYTDEKKYFLKMFKKHENITPSRYRNIYYNTCINSE